MKKYKFTILIAILVLLFTVKITKPNMGLSPDEIFEKVNETKKNFDSIIQIENSSVTKTVNNDPPMTLEEIEKKNKELSNIIEVIKSQNKKDNGSTEEDEEDKQIIATQQYVRKERYTITDYKNEKPTDFLISNYMRHSEENKKDIINEVYYRFKNNKGYSSINFGPWKEDDKSYLKFNDYHKIIELLNKYYKNFEIEEGDEFYLFTLNDEGLNNNDAMELANSLGMSKLIDESKLLNSKTYKDMDWDYTRLSVKFIIKRDSMYLQNVIYDLELQKDDICYNAQSKTNFEQFGIVTKYATPEELPEFNY